MYIGLESGNETVLRLLNKGFNKEEQVDSLKKLEESKLSYNAMIMLGSGGKKYSKIHMEDSLSILNRFKPKILSLLSTTIEKETLLYEMVENKEFPPLTEKEMIDEELFILKNIELDDDAYFFGNHEFNTIPATGYFKHKKFIIEYIEEEYERLLNEKRINDEQYIQYLS